MDLKMKEEQELSYMNASLLSPIHWYKRNTWKGEMIKKNYFTFSGFLFMSVFAYVCSPHFFLSFHLLRFSFILIFACVCSSYLPFSHLFCYLFICSVSCWFVICLKKHSVILLILKLSQHLFHVFTSQVFDRALIIADLKLLAMIKRLPISPI